MSAYVVEDKVINSIVSFLSSAGDFRRLVLAETGFDLDTEDGRSGLGNAMFALNCNAVEQRYGVGEAKSFRDLNYAFNYTPTTNPVQVKKSLDCWTYQCSEGDVPETSLLFATMERISDMLAQSIVRNLPTYEKARW